VGAHFDDGELAVVRAAVDRLVPGAADAGVADYVDTLLGAFSFDPPRLFAGGPYSGRHGGEPGFQRWIPPNRVQEKAWRTRLAGWHDEYRDGLAALGDDFTAVDGTEQDERLAHAPAFKALLYRHACEGMYGDPVYGGNRDFAGWDAIGYVGDIQPRGYTDDEVTGRARVDVPRRRDGSA